MPEPVVILAALIILAASFTHGAVGFGMGLISMPLLVGLLGIDVTAPLVALIGISAQTILTIYYREKLTLRTLGALTVATLLGVPLGVLALNNIGEQMITVGLGLFVVAYALYSLLSPRLPQLRAAIWGWVFGFTSGVLTGAYNTGGPPLIVYGTAQGWGPQEFKGNLQGVAVLKSIAVLVSHGLSGNFTGDVLISYLYVLPAMAVGIAVGVYLDRFFNRERFRKIVLVLLAVLGMTLIF